MLKRFIRSEYAALFGAAALLCSVTATTSNAQSPILKPEKTTLEVAIAASGPLYLPLLLAADAGYFDKRGLRVNLTVLSATASAQALLSGTVDIYQGGTATIHANVAGSDVIYIGAAVDKSTLVLFGQKGITTLEGLRGKSVATTSVGAFGEIAMRKTAKERGMEIGKDIKLLYHKGPPDALQTFVLNNADGLIVTPPQTEMAKGKGYPVIIDFYQAGLENHRPRHRRRPRLHAEESQHVKNLFNGLSRRYQTRPRRSARRQTGRIPLL